MSNNPPNFSQAIVGYRNLFSQKDWAKLHPSIQQGFPPDLHKTVTYQGEMEEVYLSFAGKLLAQCCRLIGTPLALYSEKNISMEVKVYPNNKLSGMNWDRFYHYKNSPVNQVTSTKCLIENAGNAYLTEMFKCGFGMRLEVYEKNGAIHFESKNFFWEFKNITINIPQWLSPGKTIISQKALDDNRFEFRLDTTHALFGKVFHQVGVFQPRIISWNRGKSARPWCA